jgi:16S rRNA U1498 N3-methylase RsmE
VRKFGEKLGGDTTDVLLIFLLSSTFYYVLSFDSSFHMYQIRRLREREKVIKRNGKGDMLE